MWRKHLMCVRHEAGLHEQRPQVARVVVRLVVVHLLGRARPSRNAENSRARLPRHDGTLIAQTPPGRSTRRNSRERLLAAPRGARAPTCRGRRRASASASSASALGQRALDRASPSGARRQVGGQRRRRPAAARAHARRAPAHERRVVAAAEVADVLAGERRRRRARSGAWRARRRSGRRGVGVAGLARRTSGRGRQRSVTSRRRP